MECSAVPSGQKISVHDHHNITMRALSFYWIIWLNLIGSNTWTWEVEALRQTGSHQNRCYSYDQDLLSDQDTHSCSSTGALQSSYEERSKEKLLRNVGEITATTFSKCRFHYNRDFCTVQHTFCFRKTLRMSSQIALTQIWSRCRQADFLVEIDSRQWQYVILLLVL